MDDPIIHVPEERFRTLLNMHAESVCRVERTATEELQRLTSFVRALIGLTDQDMPRERQAKIDRERTA